MLKIVVAMLIGAVLGAALTYSLIDQRAVDDAAIVAISPSAESSARPAAGRSASMPGMPSPATLSRNSPGISGANPSTGASPAATGAGVRAGGPAPGSGTRPGGIFYGAVDAELPDPDVAAAPDFATAYANVMRRADLNEQLRGLAALASRFAGESPGEAVAALEQLTGQQLRSAYLRSLARAAVGTRPELLAEIASRIRGPQDRGYLMSGVMQSVTALDDAEPLLAVAASLPPAIGQTLESAVYMQLANRDPRSALARTEAMPQGEARQQLTTVALMQLVMQDADAALAWLSARAATLDPAAWQAVGGMLAQQNPALAAQYALSVPEAARAGWVAATASGMAGRDADAALRWLDAYRSTQYYDDAVIEVAQQIASFDPARAADVIADVGLDSMRARALAAGVAQMWSQTDPQAALGWARELPRGETRDTVLVSISNRIGEAFLSAPTLDLIAEPRMRDSAVSQVIAAVAWSDPDRARALISQHVSDPNMEQALTDLLDNRGTGRAGIASAGFGMFAAPVGIAPVGALQGGNVIYTPNGVPQFVSPGGAGLFIGSAGGPVIRAGADAVPGEAQGEDR